MKGKYKMKYYDEETGHLFDTMDEFNKYKEARNEEKRKEEKIKSESAARAQQIKQKADEMDNLITQYIKDYGYLPNKLYSFFWKYLF